jgi:hypothetical protein
MEKTSEELLRAFVGEKFDYYNKQWEKELTFNFAAFFLGGFWLLYRKMYLVFFLTYFLLYGTATGYVLTAIAWIMLGLTANKIYYFHVAAKVNKIEETKKEIQMNFAIQKGGTSFLGPVLFGLLILIHLLQKYFNISLIEIF